MQARMRQHGHRHPSPLAGHNPPSMQTLCGAMTAPPPPCTPFCRCPQVGVATDTAKRIRAEQAMAKYQDVDKLYDNYKM